MQGMRRRCGLSVLCALLLVQVLAGCSVGGPTEGRQSPGAGAHGKQVVAASIPYYDQRRGFEVAVQHTDLFTDISFWWYSVLPDGSIGLLDQPYTKVKPRLVRELQSHGIRVIPNIANYSQGEWTPGNASVVLRDPVRRSKHVRNIVDLVLREGYDGIDIDYESLQDGDRQPLVVFLTDLGAALHAQNKLLTISVQPKESDAGDGPHNRAQDYAAIGKVVDRVNVMSYDYSYSGSDPGPVAPIDWVDRVLAYTTSQIQPEKVVLGNDLLGYDWGRGGGETVTWQEATDLADKNGADVQWDEDSQSPWFRYRGADGPHEVWFENAESTAVKLDLVEKYHLGGTFFWRLGGEDPDTWSRIEPLLQ
ncbi:MAG TPA: glycosyl hydrolase family 18 protein [Pseudonocardiaceae bacterium]|jgi:spore germination protein YaaH|nr:glycosyl hydrolase family 18 protein [Pseudonocardiaceae bacterium]